MIKKISDIFIKILFISFLLLFLLFNQVNYKSDLNLTASIFPAIDVILIYYFYSSKKIKLEAVLLISLFLDQFYFYPVGTLAFSFIIGCSVIDIISKRFSLNFYSVNCFVFTFFTLIVFAEKCMVYMLLNKHFNELELIFQYLTTILLYPSLKAFLDKIIN